MYDLKSWGLFTDHYKEYYNEEDRLAIDVQSQNQILRNVVLLKDKQTYYNRLIALGDTLFIVLIEYNNPDEPEKEALNNNSQSLYYRDNIRYYKSHNKDTEYHMIKDINFVEDFNLSFGNANQYNKFIKYFGSLKNTIFLFEKVKPFELEISIRDLLISSFINGGYSPTRNNG